MNPRSLKARHHAGFSPAQQSMIFSSLLFAVMGALVKMLDHMPVAQLVTVRAAVSVLLCYVLLRWYRLSPIGKSKTLLLVRALFGTASLVLYYYTLQRMPLATSVTISQVAPLFAVLISQFILKEKSHPLIWVLLVVSFGGVALIEGFDPRVSLLDAGLGVLAAFFSAIAHNAVRGLKESDHPLVVVFSFPLIALLTVGPVGITDWQAPTAHEWMLMSLIGVITLAAQYFMTLSYHMDKISNVTIVRYSGTLFAIAIGYFFFQETVPMESLVGMVLILFAVGLQNYALAKPKRLAK